MPSVRLADWLLGLLFPKGELEAEVVEVVEVAAWMAMARLIVSLSVVRCQVVRPSNYVH